MIERIVVKLGDREKCHEIRSLLLKSRSIWNLCSGQRYQLVPYNDVSKTSVSFRYDLKRPSDVLSWPVSGFNHLQVKRSKNNSSTQDIPSPLSDTLSPQQTPVTLKLLNKSCSDLYSQLIAIKDFLLNEICILRKEVYTNKDRMEHLISSLQDKNKITKLTIKVSWLEEENLNLRNQIIENHVTIGKMQNISNTGKGSQAKSAELDVTKLVNNGEVLTLDNESMSNEPLSKKLIFSKSIKEQMTEFQKKNHEKYL